MERDVDVAVNHCEAAIAMHTLNHPNTLHFRTDVFEVDPKRTVKRRRVDVLWLSPDCFPAGTMVRTRRGYQPIEDVKIDDEVLTHRARWRRVTAVMSKDFDGELVVIHAQSLSSPLRVTPEHPFLVDPKHPFSVNNVTWTAACDLTTEMKLTAVTGIIGGVTPTYVPRRIDAITRERATLQVFNLSVDEDESYVVDGIIVHNCTHHSRARGGKPRDGKLRSLAWVGINWAQNVQPRVIFLENVPEFLTWGPLYERGDLLADGSEVPEKLIDTPIPERRGETFRAFIAALTLAGYKVEWKTLRACDYGVPTTRDRLYLVARCDNEPIVWPEPTHGKNRGQEPYHTAHECIDYSIPCPSIFMDRQQARAWAKEARKTHPGIGVPQRPLSEATQRRIAEGIKRYVLGARRPFIVNLTHGGRLEDIDEPMKTITAAHRGEKAIVEPFLVNLSHGGRLEPADEPMRTITATPKGGDRAVVVPYIVNTRNGERAGQAPRTRDILRPLPTVTAEGSQGALVAAFLAKGVVGSSLEAPLGTVTAIDHHSLAAVHIAKLYGTSTGSAADEPLHTVTGQGGKHALVAAFLLKYYKEQWSGVDEPMHTIVTKARMGLVTVTIDGEEYVIVDIGFRMLHPRELARAQGFPDDYQLVGTKEQQIARIGNSVCPGVVRALVSANVRWAA